MAEASIPVRQLDDVTECPICSELFTDPRTLPCIHTFCLECIQKWGKERDKTAGKLLPCPICRKEFQIPDGGFGEIPKNFFVVRLMDVRKLASALSVKETSCDLCKGKTQSTGTRVEESDIISTAVVHCVECDRNLCQECLLWHKQFQSNASHKLLEFNQLHVDELQRSLPLPETRCDQHPDKVVEIYCFECNMPTCYVCYITKHNGHKCSDVKQVADERGKQMKTDVDSFTGIIEEVKMLLQKLTTEQEALAGKMDNARREIEWRAEAMKQMIEECRIKNLEELDSERKEQEKKMTFLKEELEGRLMMMESYVRYSEELRSKGTAVDIVRAGNCLHDRAKELMQCDVRSQFDANCRPVEINLSTDSEQLKYGLEQLFGVLDVHKNLTSFVDSMASFSAGFFKPPSKPVGIIPGSGGGVTDVTSHGNEIFVVRDGASTISVYDAGRFTPRRCLELEPGVLANLSRLATCSTNNCIYMTHIVHRKIYRVLVTGGGPVTSWTVENDPRGISVNSENNVLVACFAANIVQEYTTRGILVRCISLQPNVTCPVTVVELPSGHLGITHYAEHCDGDRFCVVGLNGRVIRFSCGSRGYSPGRFSSPSGLTVTKRGTAFVANHGNNKLFMINASTCEAVELNVKGGLRNPRCIHYDQARNRIYIGEHGGQKRVVVLGK